MNTVAQAKPALSSFQGNLFNLDPVVKKVNKPIKERPQPLEEVNLLFDDVRATARKYKVAKQTVYHVVFSDQRKPLVVTIALRPNGDDFWTSLPEGRQQEAEFIGGLIDSVLGD